MAFALDPQVQAALAPMSAAMAGAVPPPVGDVQTRRRITEAIMAQTAAAQPMPTDVTTIDYHIDTPDGTPICCAGMSRTVPLPARRCSTCTAAA